MHIVRPILLAMAAVALLGACSGDEFSIQFSTSSISTRAVQGSPPGSDAVVQIKAVGEGPVPDALYVGATIQGMGIRTPVRVVLDSSTKSATIFVTPDTSIAAGDYAGTLTLLACKDVNCQENFAGSPHQVAYHVELVDRLTASSPQVTVTATETTVATPVPLTATLPASVVVSYGDGSQWLQVTRQDHTVTLTADASALRPGTYRATLTLHTDAPRQTVDVPVTFIVTPALTAVPNAAVTLTGASVPADTQGGFAVRAAVGVNIPAWTAASDAGWLVLDHPAGAVGDSVTWHLDLAAVSALANFTTQTGHITVTAGPALTPMIVAVQLTKQLPEITNFDRLAVLPGQAGPVMVYGAGFQTIAQPATDLHIAGVTPTAVTVLSDRALSVTVPALPAGEYTVTLTNAVDVVTRSKPLSVLAPIDRPHEEIATQGKKWSLVWDAITQSAYAVNASLDLVMRFDLSHTPATITARSGAGVLALGMLLDHSVLVGGDAAGTLYDLDPTDLSVRRTRAAGARLHARSAPLPITGDDLAWIDTSNGLAYDLDRSAAATWVDPKHDFRCYFCAVSPDGRRMVDNQDPTTSASPPIAWWDATEGQLHTNPIRQISAFILAVSDRAGDRWIFDFGSVYDFNFAAQGTIVMPTGWIDLHYAMSRNGKRAYVYALPDGAAAASPKIFVFDTTTPPITTTTYPVFGSFDVAAFASSCAGVADCSRYSLSFTITDDDRTLLAIGDSRFLVIPIPAQYQSP